MTKEDFQQLWALNYPDTVPISYLFKQNYSKRWFRIHSLPESKRYPGNKDEWEILLTRQNEIITDLLGVDTPILLITGEYFWDEQRTTHITDEEEVFKPFAFIKLDSIGLFQIDPEQYSEADTYRLAFTKTVWGPNQHDDILREIAVDSIRAFFVSFDKNIIVAPYDGGIDFVLKDSLTKENYKNKYKQWLSYREDGL